MHFKIISLVSFALLFYVSPRVDCQLVCAFERDIDYLNVELNPGNPIFVASSDLCCYACLINPNCQLWTYVPVTRACILKRSIGSQRVSSPGSKNFFFLNYFYRKSQKIYTNSLC